MIELNHVTKSFGSLLLLKDISAVFQSGRVHLITGRNGSGKSTLLRIIGGLTETDAGTVSFHDENAMIGYLGHTTFLYPNLTAMENLAFWQNAYDRKADDDAILSVLGRVGLLPFAYTRSAVFSRGMAQRLSLARILLLQPEILLLDEPETGLDASSRSLLEKEVAAARNNGACILWVSHAAAAEQCRADAVFEIRDCRLLEAAPSSSSGKDKLAAGGSTCSN